MKIGLGHIAILTTPITAFMSLVLYHSSHLEYRVFNAAVFPFFILGWFALIYLMMKIDIKKEGV